jgi:hypothetical protein
MLMRPDADIKNAYHAMALDEHRKPFDTTMWHYPADGVAVTEKPAASSKDLRDKWNDVRDTDEATEAELAKAWDDLIGAEMYEELKGAHSNLLQVWFPGVHINIGGGSDDLLKDKKGDFERKWTENIIKSFETSLFASRPMLILCRNRHDHARLDD